jgi:hypothetical protein
MVVMQARRAPVGAFGFSWNVAFDRETQGFQLLEKLGFPWILSSEMSLFNGLHAIFAEKKFHAPSWPAAGFGRVGVKGFHMLKRGIAHGTSLSQFRIFCNQMPKPVERGPLSATLDHAAVQRKDAAEGAPL